MRALLALLVLGCGGSSDGLRPGRACDCGELGRIELPPAATALRCERAQVSPAEREQLRGEADFPVCFWQRFP